ncbi:putative Crotonase/Enoyl-Coenzyme A (CoA) hydratase superfamily protein [uncultured delta proteobacterium]|uniref:Putative Crotonase/Enoyl-Coenzyme A (CoA) hydratase superfamily protein n=1 Tax=uncultured delta proteobacterium TaxID=34034 RepID=A0A212KA64_9DELT|nr:putative Crotonase/Enoyl-Coenzyme A (CoA) hydratase superfamily protein [uncultured delta proteobacterium]
MKSIESGELLFSVTDGVADIVVNRPEKLNALNTRIVADMHAIITRLDGDNSARVVVIKAACTNNSVYSGSMAGADLDEMTACQGNFDYQAYYSVFANFYRRLRSISQPVVTVINGYAFGGACALAQSSEFVVASDKSVFGMPEINFGFPGGAATFSAQFGRQKAAEITMLGNNFDAQEAYRMLLAYKVVPETELEETVQKICATLKKRSFESLKMGKHIINVSADCGVDEAVNTEIIAASLCLNTEYARNKIDNFMKKQK